MGGLVSWPTATVRPEAESDEASVGSDALSEELSVEAETEPSLLAKSALVPPPSGEVMLTVTLTPED